MRLEDALLEHVQLQLGLRTLLGRMGLGGGGARTGIRVTGRDIKSTYQGSTNCGIHAAKYHTPTLTQTRILSQTPNSGPDPGLDENLAEVMQYHVEGRGN